MKKGLWSCSDDKILITEVLRIGRKWATIAKMTVLGSRAENSVTNRFASMMKKKAQYEKSTRQVISEKDYLTKALTELEVRLMIEPRACYPNTEEEGV